MDKNPDSSGNISSWIRIGIQSRSDFFYSVAQYDTTSVSPSILTKCLNNVEKVTKIKLSESQAFELFSSMTHKTKLKHLQINDTNFENVPEDIFALATKKLDMLNLTFSNLTNGQVMTMFEAIAEDIKVNDAAIAPYGELSDEALDKLKQAMLTNTKLSTDSAVFISSRYHNTVYISTFGCLQKFQIIQVHNFYLNC